MSSPMPSDSTEKHTPGKKEEEDVRLPSVVSISLGRISP